MAAAELLAESDVGGDGKDGMAKRPRRQHKTKQSQEKLDPTMEDLAASERPFLRREKDAIFATTDKHSATRPGWHHAEGYIPTEQLPPTERLPSGTCQ